MNTLDRISRLFVFLLLWGWAIGPALAQEQRLADLDAYIEAAMAEWEVPGLAVAVIKDDEVVYLRGFGTRAVGSHEPVDEQTLFPIASTTKAMTVAALGMLVDEGLIGWDDPVTKHLPGFQLASPYLTRHLTIRDLLTHRTGMASHNNLWIASPFDRTEILRRMRHLPAAGEFRGGYSYNNLMYMVAGEVVAAVSGMPWDDFMDKRLFIPLGMTMSTTRDEVVSGRENVSTPHVRIDGTVTAIDRRNYDALGPAGSAYSNASEMARWIRMQLGYGRLNGRAILDSATVAEMHEPQIVMNMDNTSRRLFSDRKLSAYALGWRIQDYRGRKVVQHTGLVNYTRTQVGMIPEEGIGYVAFANLTTAPLPTALMYRVFDALLGTPSTDWSAEYLAISRESAEAAAQRPEPTRTPGTTPSLPLPGYAGTYADSLYGRVVVEMEGGGLVLRYSPDYVADLEHWHYDTFRANWRRAGFGSTNVTFSLDARGRVRDLELQGFTTFRTE
jgi:CubicO group peptidase (beta-lactamase class C family)